MSNPTLRSLKALHLEQILSPFARLEALLKPVRARRDSIDMSVGAPLHAPPAFISSILKAHAHQWSTYPPTVGTGALRRSIAHWLMRRFGIAVEPDRHVLPVCGTREALFTLAPLARRRHTGNKILVPTPAYQCYRAAALWSGATPLEVTASQDNGFLPPFRDLPPHTLKQTCAVYFCNPANPQGVVAPVSYLRELKDLARRFDFLLIVDECYTDIYHGAPPPCALEQETAFDHVVVLQSLSKRSGMAGVRSGFCAGDEDLLREFALLRTVGGPQMPLPLMAVSEHGWRDAAHVEVIRGFYQKKMRLAGEILSSQVCPEAGFFLWLPCKDAEDTTRACWRGGVKVLPGSYLDPPEGGEGRKYVRVALVHEEDTLREGLLRLRTLTQDGETSIVLP